eukprot:TRINITY_DN3840_c0_g1_i3.p1 TRINITY_DN3840_c0_g1~~TRINITY_DN3840_c0_g1_i3.p1  ORF type:complete len:409 (+),score=63.21 TRINITY_DN3840_c0_g1_i3:578-1804(+)
MREVLVASTPFVALIANKLLVPFVECVVGLVANHLTIKLQQVEQLPALFGHYISQILVSDKILTEMYPQLPISCFNKVVECEAFVKSILYTENLFCSTELQQLSDVWWAPAFVLLEDLDELRICCGTQKLVHLITAVNSKYAVIRDTGFITQLTESVHAPLLEMFSHKLSSVLELALKNTKPLGIADISKFKNEPHEFVNNPWALSCSALNSASHIACSLQLWSALPMFSFKKGIFDGTTATITVSCDSITKQIVDGLLANFHNPLGKLPIDAPTLDPEPQPAVSTACSELGVTMTCLQALLAYDRFSLVLRAVAGQLDRMFYKCHIVAHFQLSHNSALQLLADVGCARAVLTNLQSSSLQAMTMSSRACEVLCLDDPELLALQHELKDSLLTQEQLRKLIGIRLGQI